MPAGPERTRVFARAFLEGAVCEALLPFVAHLKTRPAILLKPWAQERIIVLLTALTDAGVHSRTTLAAAWAKDSLFLLAPYLVRGHPYPLIPL